MKHYFPFDYYKSPRTQYHNYDNFGTNKTKYIKKPKTKPHNLSMGPVKPKNLPHVQSPLYTPTPHIKVNPIKRNSQKNINTNLSITLNPFKASTHTSSTISSVDRSHKVKSPITSLNSNKYYTINHRSILNKIRKRKPNMHNNSNDNTSFTNNTFNTVNNSMNHSSGGNKYSRGNSGNTSMIGNVKVTKKKKPRSQEKIQTFGCESGSSGNNNNNSCCCCSSNVNNSKQQQCSSSLNVNNSNKKQIHIHNKQKIIKTPISLYASSTINAHTHKRTISSVSSNTSSQKKHKQHHQHLNKASSLLSSCSNTKHPSNTTMNNISEHTHNTSSTSCSTPIKTIKNILTISKQGIDLQNLPKVNQDSFFVSTIQTTTKYKYIGVCDGHGPNGHFVSNFLKETLPKELNKHFQDKSFRLKHLPKLFEHTYLSSNSKLSNNANIDTNFSGSTAVSIVFPDNLYINPIYIANVGDSRAIVIKQSDNSCNSASWAYECLSRDHKPDERDEALRIIRFGGRIEQFKDREGKYVGPLRIWLSKENIPGLAMTRSFGDQLAATVGVVCEPEVKEYFVKEEDKCVVVASDGLWEYISNERCVNIAREYYANNVMKEELTEVLYREAKKKWKEYDINVDDITIVVIEL